MRSLTSWTYVLTTLTAVAFFATDAQAANPTWNDAGGGLADDGSNWTPNLIPGLADDLTFGLNNTFTVGWDNTISKVDTIDVSAGVVTFEDAGSADLTTTGRLEVGDNSGNQATLRLNGGVWTSGSSLRVGFNAADDGRLEVFGGAKFNSLSSIAVGFRGDGELILTSGAITAAGDLNAASATSGTTNGTALIEVGDTFDVTGTTNLGAAAGGTATLRVDGGDYTSGGATTINAGSLLEVLDGTFHTDSSLTLAAAASTLSIKGGSVSNTTGTIDRIGSGLVAMATVDGTNSMWTNSSFLYVGSSGSGTLTVQEGGTVLSVDGIIGLNFGSTGTVTVDGVGSTWTNSAALNVGNEGGGILVVENGGTVSSTVGGIAGAGGSNGTVTVTDAGSNWTNSSHLYVGGGVAAAGGTGLLTVQSGGLVDVGGLTKIWNTGTLTINGGSLNANTGLDNSDVGTLNLFDGTLTVTGGAFQPNAGGVTDDYVIEGPSAAENPHLELGAGATANIGNDLIVGDANRGMFTVTDGATVSNAIGTIGDSSGSTGTVTVNGAGSTWTNLGNLRVGRLGTGTLNIKNGGTVSNLNGVLANGPSATGTVTVDGVGSTWTNSGSLLVGSIGDGTLTIKNGGTVSNSTGSIGFNTNSTSTATVDGVGSTWTNSGDLTVGSHGTGTLTIQNGGTVSNSTGSIGFNTNSTSTATVTGSGSSWTNSGALNVGASGLATLNVEAGGIVSSFAGSINSNSGLPSMATVTGNGSTWNNWSDFYVGGGSTSAGGTGDLTVTNQGLVDVGGELKIWAPGTVNLTGGTLDAATIDHTNGGMFNMTGGKLSVTTFTGDLTNAGGTLAPGQSPGSTTVVGDYDQQSGTLEIELGGLLAGSQFAQLVVSDTAKLAGTLDVSIINGFLPTLGDMFEIITATSVVDTFDIENLPNLGGLDWNVNYGATSVVLEVVATLSADFDLDGDVDADDLNDPVDGWQARFGSDLDGGNFLDWQRQLGSGAVIATTTIPEPATCWMLLVGTAMTVFRQNLCRIGFHPFMQ